MKQKATRKQRRVMKKTRRLRRGGAGPNYCQASQANMNAYKAEENYCKEKGKGRFYGCGDDKRCKLTNPHNMYCSPKMRDPCGWY
jgi:hypothetical protein